MGVQAQQPPQISSETLPTVLPPLVVTAPPSRPTARVAGFGDRPLASLPMQASLITRDQLDDIGARHLADLIQLEASASDAYNAAGYWDSLAVRGFVLDPRFNQRREGLPINAETVIPLENKERVEILKGTSGIQAGTSAPGGLIHYVVKRPTDQPRRSVTLTVGERGTVGLAADVSDRAGVDGVFGYRVNVAREGRQLEVERLDRQQRSLFAFAADWHVTPTSLLQGELEWSRQVSYSAPGYSLLGRTVPAVRRPANLNNQPWSQPNQFDAFTGSLRLDHRLDNGWHWVTEGGSQRLSTDDRLAYPFGCEAEDNFTSYCSNGSFDLYDYRSDNERRRLDSMQTSLQGGFETGALKHDIRMGLLTSSTRNRFQERANNLVGRGNIDGSLFAPGDARLNDAATNQTEKSDEVFFSDAVDWGRGWTTWLGLRHSRLTRSSVRTDGTRPTSYRQGVTTPWLAASHEWKPNHFVYASWGQGAESDVVPGKVDDYTRAGEALPVLKSRQWEVGAKGRAARTDWSLAYFDVDRPAVTDSPPSYAVDGRYRHRGAEAALNRKLGRLSVHISAMALDAQRDGAADAALDGKRPVNTPRYTLRLQSRYRVASVQGLDLSAALHHEGRRSVLPDESIDLPSWTRTDLALRYRRPIAGASSTWRLGIDNVFDRRAWKASPLQYGHVYLFPLEARTLRLSVQLDI